MQPLSSNLRAEYIEMINNRLDNLPIENVEDFTKIKNVLKFFLKNHEVPDCNKQLKDRIVSIKEMVDNPDMYAASCHKQEFKQIIDERIAGKIKELKNLTTDQKEKHIDFLNAKKAEREQKHEVLSNATPPEVGSEGHTISEDQFLREEQMRWSNQSGDNEGQGILLGVLFYHAILESSEEPIIPQRESISIWDGDIDMEDIFLMQLAFLSSSLLQERN